MPKCWWPSWALDGVGDGEGEGDGVGLEGTTGAVTSKVATPTVPEFWPIASSRWVPAGKSAGTMNSTLATPVWSAVTGDSVIGSENSVRLTCSPARNPEKQPLGAAGDDRRRCWTHRIAKTLK